MGNEQDELLRQRSSSLMNTLVLWNINKAIEGQPNLVLKKELKEAEESLGQNMNVSDLVSLSPHKRHISCALLAWQQLGHSTADSLCRFYESQIKDTDAGIDTNASHPLEPGKSNLKNLRSCTTSPYNIPPALKLPCAESIVMPITVPAPDNARGRIKKSGSSSSASSGKASPKRKRKTPQPQVPCACSSNSGSKKKKPCTSPNLRNENLSTCCFEPKCNQRLMQLDNSCKELKQRLGKLAQREANRVRLLERAEAAWVQLELEYTRRLQAVTDKEEDIERQIKKLAEERNSYKTVSANLVGLLKPRGADAEKARETLREIEGKLCKLACERLRLNESAAKEDSQLSAMQCQLTQLDRDLQFKEENTLRKKALLQGQLDSMRGLVYDSERAMRAELTGLKDQIKQVSKQLLSEDDMLKKINEEINELLKEKNEVAGIVNGCQQKCDDGMQKSMDQLIEKKKKLEELRDIVLECQCKVPINKEVQVKRTPSIAALCQCEPEYRAVNGCSCTSLRTRLLSDLLKDLFGGLQSEMGDIAFRMPCQLLKCLENKHSWNKGSSVTTNLTKFFQQLLVEELDIAIATSIENYHARWVGATCADIVKRPIPDVGGPEIENWQDRALASKAEAMATEMAEKMFKEKVDEIIAKATEAVTKGPQPCLCKPKTKPSELAVYHVQVNQKVLGETPHQRRLINASKDSNKPMKPNRDPDSTKVPKVSAQKPQVPEKQQSEKQSRLKFVTPTNITPISTVNRTFDSKKTVDPFKSKIPKPTQIQPPPLETNKVIDEYWQRTQAEISELRTLIEQSFEKKNSVITDNKFTTFVDRGAITEAFRQLNNSPVKKEPKHITIDDEVVKIKNETKKVNQKKNDLRTYAVNYVCFCGMHRNKPKDSGSLSQLSECPTKTRKIAPIKSKQKSIELTPPITSAIDKTPSESTCECFNKLPSTNSIDKFLDTLSKWNYDLKESSIGSETLENTYGSLNYKPTNIVSKMYDPSKLICLSDVTNLSTIKGLPNKPSLEVNKILLESFPPLPVSNSEYIADVNLDKSNEQCQADISSEKYKIIITNETESPGCDRNVSKIKSKSQIITGIPHNYKNEGILRKPLSEESCIASHNYTLIPIDQCKIGQVLDNEKKDVFVSDSQDKYTTAQNFNIMRLSRSQVICVPLEQKQLENPEESVQKDSSVRHFNSSQILHAENVCKTETINRRSDKNGPNLNNIQKSVTTTKPAIPCPCGYQIKFLGVTLANPFSDKPQKKSKNVTKMSSPMQDVIKNMSKVTNNSIKNKTSFAVEQNITAAEKKLHSQDADTESSFQCHCEAKLDQIKALINSTIPKAKNNLKNNTLQDKTDKFMETNSFIKSSENENCICCVKASVESKNLEANTFQLLEEHFKKKLKDSKCDDENIFKPDEEQKIISKMFKRLKLAITDMTNQAKCKCEEEDGEKGSWLRAYNLLQEYLKMKINRVQCSCSPFKGNNNIQSMLPQLTEKVCLLIENDFERLLQTRKCQNINRSSNANLDNIKVQNTDKVFNETLEKESVFALIQKDFLVSISSQVVPNQDSVSAQIIPVIDEKCCEVLQTEYAGVKTVETQKSDVINLMKNIFNQSTQYSNQTVEFNLTPSDNSINGTNSSKKKELESETGNGTTKERHLSEHGKTDLKCCTLDVTDMNQLEENRAKINEIWKKHITNKGDDRRIVSYIMDRVYKKDENFSTSYYDKDKIKHKGESCWAQHKICDNKSSNYEISELMLNDSIEHIKKSLRHDKSNMKDRNLNSNDELYFDSYPQSTDEVSSKKCVHFPSSVQSNVIKREQVEEEVFDVTHVSSSNCVCTMVPLCHVKMLIENIQQKLTNSDCTCDSLISSVCPVHASAVQYNAKDC